MDVLTKGKVMTVLGPKDPSCMGIVLPHEHLSMDFSMAYTAPTVPVMLDSTGGFTLQNLGWIRQNPYSHKENLNLSGVAVEAALKDELLEFSRAGGGTIVENTTTGINHNVPFMKTLMERTGVNIVAGTGYYIDMAQSRSAVATLSTEAMATVMTRDLTQGCGEAGEDVRCGILGEVGCSWPLTEFERKSVAASGEVSATIGCPVMFHPGRNERAPAEILRVFAEAGGDVGHAVMAHLDRTIHCLDGILEFAKLGSYLEYDLFGIETSQYQLNPAVDIPSDAQRIVFMKHLAENGYQHRLLMSHDIHTRHRLRAFGGHGFCHILHNVRPHMLRRGMTQEQLDDFMIHNPQRWLTFDK